VWISTGFLFYFILFLKKKFSIIFGKASFLYHYIIVVKIRHKVPGDPPDVFILQSTVSQPQSKGLMVTLFIFASNSVKNLVRGAVLDTAFAWLKHLLDNFINIWIFFFFEIDHFNFYTFLGRCWFNVASD
jgi:hypothetical protein